MGYKSDWRSCDSEDLKAYFRVIQYITTKENWFQPITQTSFIEFQRRSGHPHGVYNIATAWRLGLLWPYQPWQPGCGRASYAGPRWFPTEYFLHYDNLHHYFTLVAFYRKIFSDLISKGEFSASPPTSPGIGFVNPAFTLEPEGDSKSKKKKDDFIKNLRWEQDCILQAVVVDFISLL